MSPAPVTAAFVQRIRSALLVVVVCVALASVAAVVQLLPAPVRVLYVPRPSHGWMYHAGAATQGCIFAAIF